MSEKNLIINYAILRQEDELELTTEVIGFIRVGWQPFGSMSAVLENGVISYIQPMVKYDS